MVDIVGGVLFRDNTILLGKRAATRRSSPNVWDVIGGHVEAHEQPIATLNRELQEEIGVTPTHVFLLECFNNPALKQHGVHLFYLYVVTSWTGTPRNLQPHEHTVIQWFSLTEAAHLDLAHPAYLDLFQRIGQSVDLH